jgi:cytochrome c oxidase subunit II
MFSKASNFVHGVDSAFLIITGISVFFLIVLTGLMIFFVFKYNKRNGKPAIQIKDNTALEITWITIPMIIVLYMFYIGWKGFIPMREAPKDAMEITAVSSMWKYKFDYPGDKESDTLVVPIDKAVKINLKSIDVLHGFSVPAFRIKEDMVPNKPNYSWFQAGELGDYDIYCTVYCGLNHSNMLGIIRVLPQADFDKWLEKLPAKAKESPMGLKVLEKNGCLACHSLDGSKVVGPTFKGLYGSMRKVSANGTAREVKADDEYIKTSITNPGADIVDGYPAGLMQPYTKISASDMALINDYFKSLK